MSAALVRMESDSNSPGLLSSNQILQKSRQFHWDSVGLSDLAFEDQVILSADLEDQLPEWNKSQLP